MIDTDNNLMWMRCSLGQNWNGNSFILHASGYIFDAAQRIASKTIFSGYSDWRLPTIQELNTLVYCSNGKRIQYHNDRYIHHSGEPNSKKTEGYYGCDSGDRGIYSKPTINKEFFPNSDANSYWSSSFPAHLNYRAWAVNFSEGTGRNGGRS